MALHSAIPREGFDEVLAWLNPDREVAATIYLQLREGLTKIFIWNRCLDPDGLTDDVFDRVSKKVHHLRKTYEGNPRLYFYGVARNLIKEEAKKLKTYAPLEGADATPKTNPIPEESEDTTERESECLQSCLEQLNNEKRELILAYYAKDKQAKIDYRHELARRLEITITTLRVRVYRIRGTLEVCVKRCLENMDQLK